MRLGAFNVENLFSRTTAFADGKGDVVEAFAALGQVLVSETYTAADKTKIVDLLGQMGLRGCRECCSW